MQIEKMFFKEFQKKKSKSKMYNCRLESSDDLSWRVNDRGKVNVTNLWKCEFWLLSGIILSGLIYFVSVVSQYFHLFAIEESEEKNADSVELILFISWGLICTIFKFKGFFDPLVVHVYVQLCFLN